MLTVKLTLPRPHPGQMTVIREARRFNVVNCGRRFGKSTLGLNRVADPVVLAYPVAWFAPSYKLMIEIWREALTLLRPIIKRKNRQERRIEFVTGGLLEFWSLDNPDAARGRRYKRLIVDEAALVRGLVDVWNLALRATLVDFSGDAFFLSTPKGRNGFWQMWQWGQDPALSEWASWQMPTGSNPKIRPAEIEAMRLGMPERVFAQEIEAKFLEDAGSVFRRVVDAATAVALDGPRPNSNYVMGVDFARSNDFTVLTVVDLNTHEVVYIDRFNQVDYAVQVGRLRACYERFRPYVIIAEQNSMGGPLVETLQQQGLPVQGFVTTNATKTQIVDSLALAFERGDIRIPSDPVLIGELQAFEMDRLPSGLIRYGAPSGQHDDCVMSLALAWSGVYDAQPLLF